MLCEFSLLLWPSMWRIVPSSPLATISRSARIDGQKRRLCPTARITPASRQASNMRAASARCSASGFSQNTCLPRGGAGDHLRRMQRVRRRQQNGVDRGIGQDGVQIVGEGRDRVRCKNLCRAHGQARRARTIFRRSWPREASTRLRPQRPRPTMAAVDHRETSAGSVRCRIASMMAALSLSGPSRSQSPCAADRPGPRSPTDARPCRAALRPGSVRRP